MALSYVREFFGLARAARLAQVGQKRELDETERLAKLARQRLDAGESLWDAGYQAEGLRLVAEGFDAATRATCTAAGPDMELAGAFDTLEVAPRVRARVEGVTKSAVIEEPALDEEILPEHRLRYEDTIRAGRSLTDAASAVLRSPLRVKLMRVGRAAAVLLSLLALGAVGYRWAFPPASIQISASEERGRGQHPASFAFDGNPRTEWLMEDRHRGYLEFTLVPSRSLDSIRILNAYNPPHNDRGVRDYRIEVVGSGSEPTILRGRFEEIDESPEWREIEIDEADVSLLRIHVDSFHMNGGGIAEVTLQESSD